jgi:hypothetical protein
VEEAELHRETREGDPRWLNIILKCVSQRVALLGLDMPREHRNGGGAEATPRLSIEYLWDSDDHSHDQLEQLEPPRIAGGSERD